MENTTLKIGEKKNFIVMYHYIRGSQAVDRGIRAFSLEKFKEQIKRLLKFYKVVLLDELYEKVKRNNNFYCALTFDDGLIDHYLDVLPILKKAGIKGAFFPITMVFEKKMPVTYKVYILLSRFPIDDLVSIYEEFIQKEFPELTDKYFLPRDRKLKPTRRFDDVLTANFKEVMNILPLHIKVKFIDKCFKDIFSEEEKLCQEFFMNENQLQALAKAGMAVGAHTHSHFPLKLLSDKEQTFEIEQSKKILEKILGQKIEQFSYPFGDYNDFTLRILQKNEFKLAVTNRAGLLTKKNNCLKLPRYDTRDLKI